MPYRLAFDVVWGFVDVMNGLMAFPNRMALLLLSGVFVNETKKFKQKRM